MNLSHHRQVTAKSLVPKSGSKMYWDDELKGFGLRVTSGGARTFIVQKRVHGKVVRRSIGRLGDDAYTPKEARVKAEKYLRWMERGLDPEEVEGARESVTLRSLVNEYLQNHRRRDGEPLASVTKGDVLKHLEKSWNEWADKPVTAITRQAVRARYHELGRRSEAQANQGMRLLRAILNYSMDIYRDADDQPIPPSNPVHAIRRDQFPDRQRQRRIPREMVGLYLKVVRATRQDPEASWSVRVKAAAIEVLMLTGLRRSDVLQRTWDQVDTEKLSLHVPDGKLRTYKIFPIPEQVGNVIRWLERHSEGQHVFPADGGVVTPYPTDLRPGMEKANAAIGMHISPHDLRRNHVDAQDELLIDPWVAELLSNRTGPSSQVMATRLASYASRDLTRYRPQSQAIADWLEERVLELGGTKPQAIQYEFAFH